MIKYVVKRLLLLIPVFLGVTFVIFFIVRLSPADPVTAILGINITEEQYLAKQAELGLDKPLLIQYVNYVINIITHLDLGISYSSGRSVSIMIAERFGTTLKLGFLGMALALILAFPVASSLRRGSTPPLTVW